MSQGLITALWLTPLGLLLVAAILYAWCETSRERLENRADREERERFYEEINDEIARREWER